MASYISIEDDSVVCRTPFSGARAYAAVNAFASMSWSFYGVSIVDGRALVVADSPDDVKCVRERFGPDYDAQPDDVRAFVEWFDSGELTDAGREMAENALVRDPLEVEEFEDYLEAVVASRTSFDCDELIAARMKRDGRTAKVWWYSERTRRLVQA